jgi:hypothetical protein
LDTTSQVFVEARGRDIDQRRGNLCGLRYGNQ